MSQRIIKGTLNTWSLGGTSQLAFIEDAEIVVSEDQVDGAGIFYAGGNAQGLKKGLGIRCSLLSDITTAIRASHLDLSELEIGANDLLAEGTANFTLNIDVPNKMKPGAGSLWKQPTPVNRTFNVSGEVGIVTDNAPGLLVAMGSNTYADLNLALAMTLGGVEFDIPIRLNSTSVPFDMEGIQRHSFTGSDRSGRAGVTVNPTGTTSLLQKIVNAWQTAIAFSFIPASAPSISYSGNAVFRSATIPVVDGALSPIQYNLESTGAVTIVATS